MNESHALRRLLRFLWQFRLWLLISLLCAFISVLFSVIAPLLIGRIIDGITSGTALHAVMRELVLLAALYRSGADEHDPDRGSENGRCGYEL